MIVVAELLGFARLLRPGWISFAWITAAVLAVVYLWRSARSPATLHLHLRDRISSLAAWRPRTNATVLEVITIALALGATGLIACLAPPTNFDAMTYQLPRVMHWFQQGTLEHFPTANVRQLSYGPGAAYWQAHLWSLLDGDAGANFPQWFAYVGCALALSLWIGRFFGSHAVRFALVFGLTLPMAVLQASSVQTDLQVAAWIFIGLVLASSRDAARPLCAVLAGLAFGLAVTTKPSAALCIAPLSSLAYWLITRRRGLRAGLIAAILWAACALAICLPHFARNIRAFGNPLGDSSGTVVTALSPRLAIANAARWGVLNLPSLTVWHITADAVRTLGVEPNQPDITFFDSKFEPASPYVVHRLLFPDEDFVSYATALAALVLLWFVTWLARAHAPRPLSLRHHPTWTFWLCAVLFALGLHVVLLKWQYWGNRLLLPCALLLLPSLAAMTRGHRWPRLRALLAAACLLQTAALLSFSFNRPLVHLPSSWEYAGPTMPLFSGTRTERFYFGYNSEAAATARELVARGVSGQWHRVGLSVDKNYPEYVLWRALHDAGLDQVELHHFKSPPPRGTHYDVWPPPIDGVIYVPSTK
jgi:4-amino-4-deoxy-L-arabinose transferase-like glycosyltransferase